MKVLLSEENGGGRESNYAINEVFVRAPKTSFVQIRTKISQKYSNFIWLKFLVRAYLKLKMDVISGN